MARMMIMMMRMLRVIMIVMATMKMMIMKTMMIMTMKISNTKLIILIRRDQSCLQSSMFWTSTILTDTTR